MKKIIIIGIIIAIRSIVKAQDYQLSQIMESPVLLNPANAGLRDPAEVHVNYRQQWRSIRQNHIRQ